LFDEDGDGYLFLRPYITIRVRMLISYEGGPLNLDYLHWIPIKVN